MYKIKEGVYVNYIFFFFIFFLMYSRKDGDEKGGGRIVCYFFLCNVKIDKLMYVFMRRSKGRNVIEY